MLLILENFMLLMLALAAVSVPPLLIMIILFAPDAYD